MVAMSGRQVTTIEEAKEFLRYFMAHGSHSSRDSLDTKQYDFDLFLPWLWECITAGNGELSLHDLSVMYMDAAWDLLKTGYLRPGPRTIMGTVTAAHYGKGYSLTPQGRAWVDEVRRVEAKLAS